MQQNELVLNKRGVEKTGWIVEYSLLETDFPVPFFLPQSKIVYTYELDDVVCHVMPELNHDDVFSVSFGLGTETERRKQLESYYDSEKLYETGMSRKEYLARACDWTEEYRARRVALREKFAHLAVN